MKLKISLCAFICTYFASICMAQQGNESTNEQNIPAIYVLDGERTSFAYGRVIASNKIAIGLTDEGVYELRDDSTIWLVKHPARKDEMICKIVGDFMENKLFVHVMSDENLTPIDTICIYNSAVYIIFDKAGNITGTIQSDGIIVSPQSKALLLNLQNVDNLLATFFFVYHYMPIKKQLQFSCINTIVSSHIYRPILIL